MGQINKYADLAAYEADSARDRNKSAVSLMLDSQELKFDGKMVITNDPKTGDMVFYDSDNKVHFIALDTYVASSKPSGWNAIGVVAYREGDKVAIIWKENASKKWTDVFRWTISGINLDGQSHASNVVLHDTSCGTFTYAATTKDSFAVQLHNWLQDHSPSGFQYSCYVQDGRVVLQLDNFTNYQGGASMAGLTVTSIMNEGIKTASNIYKYNGAGSEGGIFSLARAIEYFSDDISNSSYNPTSEASLSSNYCICKPAYLGQSQYRDADYCSNLRAKYGEGEDGWRNYMNDMRVVYPTFRGALAAPYDDSKANTAALSDVTYKDRNSNTYQPLYLAAHYCSTVGIDGVEQLSQGDFYLLSGSDMVKIYAILTYGLRGVTITKADPINRSLNAIGGSLITLSIHKWSGSVSSNGAIWICYGHSGTAASHYLFNANSTIPIAIYNLSKRK